MQADERIHVRPVTSGRLSTVDHGHLDIRLGDQRVGESKAARTCPDDEIVGVDLNQNTSAISAAARAAPSRGTGTYSTSRPSSLAIAAAIASGGESSNSIRRPAA